MSVLLELRNDLEKEAKLTRKYLALVPLDQKAFRLHEKSESLGRLAVHIAELLAWWTNCLTQSELDFNNFEAKDFDTNAELLAYFDSLLNEALAAFNRVDASVLNKNWIMRNGEEHYMEIPKKEVLKTFCMHHLIHHRAQLGCYLRVLNIPVPASYGPSADDYTVSLLG